MNTILVSYDLHAPGKDYSKLREHLASYNGHATPLESFWLVKTDLTALQVCNAAKNYVDQNDELIAIDVTSRSAAWINISDGVSEWIKKYL